VQITPKQAAARLRSTAELLAQMNHENRTTVDQVRISDLEPATYVEFREITDALAQLAHRAEALAETLTLPAPKGSA
jgi:FtsZ-interacting cell division protein YlmF